jgi:hypothetical protein
MGNLIYYWFFCKELRPFSELYMRENRFWGSYFCSTGFFSVFWNKSIILISDCMKMIHIGVLYINTTLFLIMGSSWLWSYGSWIYNYLCNQCLSPLKLWVWTPFMARCTWYNGKLYSLRVMSCEVNITYYKRTLLRTSAN